MPEQTPPVRYAILLLVKLYKILLTLSSKRRILRKYAEIYSMKLSVYAKKLGVSYRTAWSYFKQGIIPGAYQMPTGTIIVPDKAIHPIRKNSNDNLHDYKQD